MMLRRRRFYLNILSVYKVGEGNFEG